MIKKQNVESPSVAQDHETTNVIWWGSDDLNWEAPQGAQGGTTLTVGAEGAGWRLISEN